MRKHPLIYFIAILVLLAMACNFGPLGSDEEEATEVVATSEPATVVPATETAEPSPTPEPTEEPTPEPSPTPEPLAAEDWLQSAREAMAGVESYHMVMDMQISAGGEGLSLDVPILFEADFLAPDSMAGNISFSMFGLSMESQIISIGDESYATNIETGEWELSSDSGAGLMGDLTGGFGSPDSVLDLDNETISDLTIVGNETVNGIAVIHLQGVMQDPDSTDAVNADFWIGVDDNYFHQIIIEGENLSEGGGESILGMEGESSVLMTITFSNFNEPVEIERPEVSESSESFDEPGGFTSAVKAVAFLDGGNLAAYGGTDNIVHIRSIDPPGEIVADLEGHQDWIRSLAVSPDGTLLASGSDDMTVIVWDTGDWQPMATLEGHEDWVQAVAFSPDGRLLASGSDDATIRLWNVDDFDAEAAVLETSGFVFTLAFSPDGNMLAAAGDDRVLYLWDLNELDADPQELEGHSDWIRSLAFSPDGHTIATGSDDLSILVWDTGDLGENPTQIEGHSDWVRAVAFNDDGAFLASAGDDMTILVWDMSDLSAPLQTLTGHEGWVNAISFSPLDDSILSGSDDRSVRLWLADTPGEFVWISGEGN